jgi:thymidylate synthase
MDLSLWLDFINYINFKEEIINMSYADLAFKGMVTKILTTGTSTKGYNVRPKWADGTPAHTIKAFSVVNRYDLSQEFPAPTLRPVNFKACIDEILWIWQRKSNNIHDLNSHIWDSWADENGSIGKAYGWQVGNKFRTVNINGEKVKLDQIDYIIHELKCNPLSRRIIGNLYNIDDLDEMNLDPCCYSITLNVVGKKLNMLLNQRSQDTVVAGEWNVVQYAVLLHMLAQVTGYEVGELVHVIADCHIYDRHLDIAEELISREAYDAPTFWINPEVTDFYKFTVDDFRLDNYKHHDQIKNIPVAI